jgi:hypothetical protein
MTADDFTIGGYDGPTAQGGLWNRLPIPFEIAAVRPDVFGICKHSTRIAVGEAKTADDVCTRHTIQQFKVLGHLRDRQTGELCKLYIGIPRSAAYALDRVLASVGLINKHHVTRLHIPDCLLVEQTCEQR